MDQTLFLTMCDVPAGLCVMCLLDCSSYSLSLT